MGSPTWHPSAAGFALIVARFTHPASASPSIARHATPLSEHSVPACVCSRSLRSFKRAPRASRAVKLALFAWNSRILLCYSVLLAASKNATL
jgi:hypothetical protein